MSEGDNSEGQSSNPRGDDGVLANLPRTRPQRPSRRRTEARKASAGAKTGGTRAVRSGSRAKPGRAGVDGAAPPPRPVTAKTRRRADSPPAQEPVPRQGFESESEIVSGSVQPPGGAELVTSAAEVVGELAKAGASAGERLLRD